MKAIHFIIITLGMLSLASCSASETDPLPEESSIYTLMNTYGATNLFAGTTTPEDLRLNELTGITAAEAYTTLDNIRKHEASRKNSRTSEELKSGKVLLKVEMNETVSGKYTFSLLLHLTKYADGPLFFNGYEADCPTNSFKWYRKGFSFSCDNSQPGCYKFETLGYLYFKIMEKEVQYLKVPFTVTGTYNPSTQVIDFTYNL